MRVRQPLLARAPPAFRHAPQKVSSSSKRALFVLPGVVIHGCYVVVMAKTGVIWSL